MSPSPVNDNWRADVGAQRSGGRIVVGVDGSSGSQVALRWALLEAAARNGLVEAVAGGDAALARADRLCAACVRLLGVDGAAISMMLEGSSGGTFGSSDELGLQLAELQFTFGEGPCTDAARAGAPVIVVDLAATGEDRWTAYIGSVLALGVRAVYALPIQLGPVSVGALDLYRHEPGPLARDALIGALIASDLAATLLSELMDQDVAWASRATPDKGAGWAQVTSLAQIEIYQATGMVMSQLGVGATEALVRLRAHAFANNQTR